MGFGCGAWHYGLHGVGTIAWCMGFGGGYCYSIFANSEGRNQFVTTQSIDHSNLLAV